MSKPTRRQLLKGAAGLAAAGAASPLAGRPPAGPASEFPATELLSAQGAAKPAPGPDDFGYLTATDGLGRTLPQYGQVRPPQKDRYVGIFYLVWLGQHGTSGPYNITHILDDHPEAVDDVNHPAWGPAGAMHHWGKPLFGYYFSDDPWVLRRDAQMLANAQIDFLVIDQTNGFPYLASMHQLMEVFDDVRQQGWAVPQITFYTRANSGGVIQADYEEFYKPGLYPDLWFHWEGKPLIIGEPDQVSQEIRDFFTFRLDQWPNEPQKPLGFPWISFQKPQQVFYVNGEPEIVPVAGAVHNNFPFSDQPFYGYGNNWSRSFHDGALDNDPDAYLQGYQFAEQWQRAPRRRPEDRDAAGVERMGGPARDRPVPRLGPARRGPYRPGSQPGRMVLARGRRGALPGIGFRAASGHPAVDARPSRGGTADHRVQVVRQHAGRRRHHGLLYPR